MTTTISKKAAIKLYVEGNEATKKFLESKFPKKLFVNGPPKQLVSSKKKEAHAKVCKELGIDPATIPMIMDVQDALKLLKSKDMIPKFKDVSKDLRDHFLAEWSLIKIFEAMNLQENGKPWIPDYTPGNTQSKWEVRWFEIKADTKNPSGFGFSNSSYVFWSTAARCGSRLACREENRLRFIMKAHEGLFIEKYLIIKPKK